MTVIRSDRLELGFSLVGPGRVGSSMARWLRACGASLTAVAGRSEDSGTALANELGGDAFSVDELRTAGDDLLLIAVDDGAVADVATALADAPQARAVLHVSGSVGVEALAPLRNERTAIGGVHPLRAFPVDSRHVADAAETLFAIGGDPAAIEVATAVVERWQGRTIPIEDEQRPLYHLAASLAAGGVVTLLSTAAELAARAGLPSEVVASYHQLACQALTESERRSSPAEAITGPIARADLPVVESHLAALGAQDPEAVEIVVALARETLRQRAAVGGVGEDHSRIASTLAKVMERKSFLDRP